LEDRLYVLKLSSFDQSRQNANHTVHIMFEGRFWIRQKGWEDGLHITVANFFSSNKCASQGQQKDRFLNKPSCQDLGDRKSFFR
jgi:hypothetical protein